VTINAEWEPCRLLNLNRICQCFSDFTEILCENRNLNEMPVINSKIAGKIQKMYLNENDISFWPEEGYWLNYSQVVFISLLNNPVCKREKEIPGKVDVLLTECSSKYFFLLSYVQ
jgi:hypothetical protein